MKYSEEIIAEICKYIENGHTQKDAASLVGIGEKTFYRWKKEKRQFRQSLRLAHTRFKDKLLKVLLGSIAIKKDARTALEILARQYPDEWGEKLKLETTINPQEEIKKLIKRVKEGVSKK